MNDEEEAHTHRKQQQHKEYHGLDISCLVKQIFLWIGSNSRAIKRNITKTTTAVELKTNTTLPTTMVM